MTEYNVHIHKNNTSRLVKVTISNRDITLMELIPPMQKIFDEIIRSELSLYHNIACQKECGECCRQLVPVSIPEAFFLDDLINSLPRKKQIHLNHRFVKITDLIKDAGLMDDLKNPKNYRNIDQIYYDLKLKCPFLEDNLCMIYKYRPFVCREYHVTSEPHLCTDPYKNEVQKIKIQRNVGAMMAVFAARLYGKSPVPIPLILSPSWAPENRNLALKKWPGIWLFTRFTDVLTSLNNEEIRLEVEECR